MAYSTHHQDQRPQTPDSRVEPVYRSETERTQALEPWLHTYNHHRNHTAIGGPPIETSRNAGESGRSGLLKCPEAG